MEEHHHVLCVLPQKMTHILNKLILIFLPFLCLSFLFFSCIFLASKPKKILIHKPKTKTSNPNTTFSNRFPFLLKYSQTFLSLPKLSQLFLTPWSASSAHRHCHHHHNQQWFFLFFLWLTHSLYLTIHSNLDPNGLNSLYLSILYLIDCCLSLPEWYVSLSHLSLSLNSVV